MAAAGGGYGPAKEGKKTDRIEPYESEFSTPAQQAAASEEVKNLATAPLMPAMNDPDTLIKMFGVMLKQELDAKFDPLIQRVERVESSLGTVAALENQLKELQSKFDDLSARDVPMDRDSSFRDALKTEVLAELRAENGSRTVVASSKSAPTTPRSRTQGTKYAYNQGDIDMAMIRLEFQITDASVAMNEVEAKMYATFNEKCPNVSKPKVVKSAFSFPNQTSKRIHFEFESKEDRNSVRNSFRQKNADNQWESCVEGVEVWCPEPAFLFHRNRPLLEMRRLIASQKGVSVQSIKVDKNGRKLTLDGKTVALQNLKTWQVEPVSEEEAR